MSKFNLPRVLAALAAVVATSVIVNAVVSLADSDKAALVAAHGVRDSTLAANGNAMRR